MDAPEIIRNNGETVADLLAMTRQQRFHELAKAFARERGHVVAGDGSIAADGRTVAQGWVGYVRRHRADILDWIVGEVSPSATFEALLQAENGYYPTMRIDLDWRMLPLADAYDAAQEQRGDRRRAFRVMPEVVAADHADADEVVTAPRP
ncbi:hypothetical protein [Methylobacterium radiotolerans]|uniref:hypothetical protein n=1 Tax=Methylobacterium radiotolerans TaxID=31998 RepID=UPI0038D122F3